MFYVQLQNTVAICFSTFIRRQKGACIQCNVKMCFTAYHATCAQRVNLYMKIAEEDMKYVFISMQAGNCYCLATPIPHSLTMLNLGRARSGEPKNVSYCDQHTPDGWGPVLTGWDADVGKVGRGRGRKKSTASVMSLPDVEVKVRACAGASWCRVH